MTLIHSADRLIEIRDLRNQISHKYIPEAITELVPEVIENCSLLIQNIQQTKRLLKARNW
ncbi:hypothetical protein NC99_00780 [Sunxiuqinia dokdonensis]|uniref:Uncharacterized protein n=2 Tax=Sunxiuqinia dokdonensis TaxID=1409788 RepID=A0A0L8VG12_9BACT|nr:hypothetical protein NC99_00780 [Sunxiuqinia dokdonensis]